MWPLEPRDDIMPSCHVAAGRRDARAVVRNVVEPHLIFPPSPDPMRSVELQREAQQNRVALANAGMDLGPVGQLGIVNACSNRVPVSKVGTQGDYPPDEKLVCSIHRRPSSEQARTVGEGVLVVFLVQQAVVEDL